MRGDVRNSSASGANALMRFAAGWTTIRRSRRASRRSASSITIYCAPQVAPRNEGGSRVIEMRRAQLSFGDGLIAEEVSDLRDHWMAAADRVLADTEIITAVYEALAQRHPESRSRGRKGMAAEIVLRLLVLKHVRNWSYEVLEREVRANLVYRDFTCVGGGKGPDAKTMGRWGMAVGPQVLERIHARIVTIARERGVVAGRRMRVDTTVVETNIHYPTDSSLLGDGVRVLTRTMKNGIAKTRFYKLIKEDRALGAASYNVGCSRAWPKAALDAWLRSKNNPV